MDEIMDIIFAMEQEFEEAESEARQEFHSLRDEIKNKVCLLLNYIPSYLILFSMLYHGT